MKISRIILLIGIMAGLSSCSRHDSGSPSTSETDESQSVTNSDTNTSNNAPNVSRDTYVRVAVVKSETVDRIRSLFTKAGIKVVADKIVVPAGGFHYFPDDTYKISVPTNSVAKAMSLIREDAPKGKYWIQAGVSVLNSIDPPNTALEPTPTAP